MTRSLKEAIEAKDLSKSQEVMKQINQAFHSYVSKGILTKILPQEKLVV